MRAVQYTEFGGPEVLSVTDVAEPHAGPGQIRITVRAASINPIDWKLRSGAYGGTIDGPQTPGADAAGVVDEVGEGIDGVAVGDRVFGLASGAYAEHAVLRAWARTPHGVDDAVAAASGVAGETSVRGLDLLALAAGDTVFIAGGSGGVGTAAVQVALSRGLRVIASAGAGSQDYLRDLGATPVRYVKDLVDQVRAAAGRGQVDGIFDVVGKTPVEDLLALVAEPASVVSIANFQAGGAGIRVSSGGHGDPQAALSEIANLLADGRLHIPVQTFPLDQAGEAQRVSSEGHVKGKLVLLT
jgi:NADPH:quinone reductase-like Zn-dependent oxidoreductase